MLRRKYVEAIFSIAIISTLVGSLFYYNMVQATNEVPDPWCDFDDDMDIDEDDLWHFCSSFIAYWKTGTLPINKTELLLNLNATVAKLLTTLYVDDVNERAGIGTTDPHVRLDVDGAIKIGSAFTCDASTEGSLRYNTYLKRMEFCDGTSWRPIYYESVKNGQSQSQAALSARAILEGGHSTGNGWYWIDPNGGSTYDAFPAFCDMTTAGGGWTLVLLSNAGVSSCPQPSWNDVVNDINYNGDVFGDLSSFDMFVGVKYWKLIGNEMRLDMGASPGSLSHRAYYDFSLDDSNYYQLSMSNEWVEIHTEGTASPGMYTYHNNKLLSTFEADHDEAVGNCATTYNNAAWWYDSCWSGSFWGDGGSGLNQDGPFWSGNTTENFSYGSIWIR